MNRTTASGVLCVVATLSLATLFRLIVIDDVGSQASTSRQALLTCLLLVVAPATTFIPFGRWARVPLFDIEAIAGWSMFGFTLTFLSPQDPPTRGQFLLFLVPMTIAIATIATIIAYLIGLRVYRGDRRQRDVVRARRQGYLAAMFTVALVLLHSAGTLSPASGVLLLLIVILIEMFALSRGNVRVGPG